MKAEDKQGGNEEIKLIGFIEDARTIHPLKRNKKATEDKALSLTGDREPQPMLSTLCTRSAITTLSYGNRKTGLIDLTNLKLRDEEIGRGKEITLSTWTEGGNVNGVWKDIPKIVYEIRTKGRGENETVIKIELADVEAIGKYNKSAVKIFYFIMQKALKKYGRNPADMAGQLISFPLEDLVKEGAYANIQSARRGVETALNVLQLLKIEIQETRGKKHTQSRGTILFPDYGIEDRSVWVELNKSVKWGLICGEYTLAPSWVYQLSYNAFRAITYIYIQARRNMDTVIKNGGISISAKALIRELNLPDPKETKHPTRDIKTAILNTIKEINQKDAKMNLQDEEPHPSEIAISPKKGARSTIRNFIENGTFYAKIGDFYINYFSKLNSIKKRRISKAVSRKKPKKSEE